MDQDQLNPYVANEGYVLRVPHNPLMRGNGTENILTFFGNWLRLNLGFYNNLCKLKNQFLSSY